MSDDDDGTRLPPDEEAFEEAFLQGAKAGFRAWRSKRLAERSSPPVNHRTKEQTDLSIAAAVAREVAQQKRERRQRWVRFWRWFTFIIVPLGSLSVLATNTGFCRAVIP